MAVDTGFIVVELPAENRTGKKKHKDKIKFLILTPKEHIIGCQRW